MDRSLESSARRRRQWILMAALLTMFLSSMDQTVVSTALPNMIADLSGFSLYAWVFTGYMMAAAVTMPIYGKLSDIYGRKPLYFIGFLLFLVGSALSGDAHSMTTLIVARSVQGAGAGGLMSLPRSTIGDLFGHRQRGRWMGVMGAVYGVAAIVGPATGGWITDVVGWRWVFFLNLPVAALAMGLILGFHPSTRARKESRPDYVGSALLVVGLVSALLGFTWGGTRYAWGSWPLLSLFGVGALMLAAFAVYETKVKDPLLHPALFRNRVFTSSMAVGLMVSMGLFGSLMFLPLFMQGVVGLSASDSGLVLAPMMCAFIAGNLVGGFLISRTGHFKLQAHLASFTMILGIFGLIVMPSPSGLGYLVACMSIAGAGVGALMPLLNVAVQNAFPHSMLGTVNATQQFVTSLGGVIASPLLGSLITGTVTEQLEDHMPASLVAMIRHLPQALRRQLSNPQSLTSPGAQQALTQKLQHFPHGSVIAQQFLAGLHASLNSGIGDLFRIALLFSCIAFVGTFFLREAPVNEGVGDRVTGL